MEADRIRRQIEFDKLEAERVKALEYNKEQIKKQRFEMVKETQEMNQKIESEYNNYMEVDMREQFLIDERLAAYRKLMETNRNEQLALVSVITKKQQEEEKKRLATRSEYVTKQKEEQEIMLRAEEKKNEILRLQEMLHRNA